MRSTTAAASSSEPKKLASAARKIMNGNSDMKPVKAMCPATTGPSWAESRRTARRTTRTGAAARVTDIAPFPRHPARSGAVRGHQAGRGRRRPRSRSHTQRLAQTTVTTTNSTPMTLITGDRPKRKRAPISVTSVQSPPIENTVVL